MQVAGNTGDFESYLSEEISRLRCNRASHSDLSAGSSTVAIEVSHVQLGIDVDVDADNEEVPDLIPVKELWRDSDVAAVGSVNDHLPASAKEVWETKYESQENPAALELGEECTPQLKSDDIPKDLELKTLEDALNALDTNGEWVYELCK
jgi:hypothetical protein